ncbi:MAG: hypothetical protein ABJO36_01145 [Litorimonas sp.]
MSAVKTNIAIVKVETPSEIKRFLALPYDLYRGQSAWAPPLRLERAEQLDPKKNPAAANLDRQLFLAVRDGQDVGRIAAFTNPAHDTHHDAETAFFGYFDAIEDSDVLSTLLEEAQNWAKEKGRSLIVGPAQWGVNEEVGLLVDGFDDTNVVLMSYGRPYYAPAVEAAGFSKAIDMLAFQADLNEGYPRPKMTRMMVDYAERSDAITWRTLDAKDFNGEVTRAMHIFNDAWSENWGFLPFPDDAIQHLAKEMKPLIAPERFLMGSIDGELAAFLCLLPDLNELARGFDGKLLPFNWAKLVYRLKTQKAKQARIPLMGLRQKYHNTRKGLALIAALCEESFEVARQAGFTHCELSWILEDNEGMISICKQASAKPYKTYRMYEKRIG